MRLDLVDVFGTRAMSGNPLGVVHAVDGLDTDVMRALTRWLGFAETTFLLPAVDPAADYRVRIFYPGGELPFAGHPTLGTCHAWLQAGGKPRREGVVLQECGIGLVEIRRDHGRLAFRAPPLIRDGELDPVERADAIRIAGVDEDAVVEAVHVSNGPAWKLLRLRTAEDVLAANPAAKAPPGTAIGLAGPSYHVGGADWEVRAFVAHAQGRIVEDPVTGSFNAGLAVHIFASGLGDHGYVAAQGRKVGADGRVYCSMDEEGTIWIGGDVRTIAAGAELSTFARSAS